MSFAFLPLYTGDYLRDTRHLTPLKHGIYLLLLMHCWDQKGPLPLDEQECAGIANCRSADEIDALRYVLGRFFVRMDDGWYNERMTEIVAESERISQARSRGGLEKARRQRDLVRGAARDAEAVLEQNLSNTSPGTPTPTPIPTPTTKKPKPSCSPAGERDASFQEFWKAYPRRVAKQSALKAWRKLDPSPDLSATILAAVAMHKASRDWSKDDGKFIPHAATWLNAKRWEDEVVTTDESWRRDLKLA